MTAVRSVRAIVLAGAGPVVFYVAVLRNHALDGRPPALSACTAGGIALVAVCAWWIALGGRGVLGRPRAWLIAAALAGPVWVACWKLFLSAATPALMTDVVTRPGARCLGLTLLLGLWPLAVTVYFWRKYGCHPSAQLRCRIGYGGRSVRGLLGRSLVSRRIRPARPFRSRPSHCRADVRWHCRGPTISRTSRELTQKSGLAEIRTTPFLRGAVKPEGYRRPSLGELNNVSRIGNSKVCLEYVHVGQGAL